MKCETCGGTEVVCKDCAQKGAAALIKDARDRTIWWLRKRADDYELPPTSRDRSRWAALARDIADRLKRGEDLE